MGNKYFGASQDALRMMIPLVINRRNIEASAAEQDKRLGALREQSEAQLLRDLDKQTAEEKRAKSKVHTDLLIKQLESAQEAQAPEQFQALASQLEQLGVQLPSHFSSPEGVNRYHMIPPKPDKDKESLPNTLEAVMARGANTPEEAMESKKKLIQWQQQQEAAYKPQTADEKIPPLVKAAMDFLRTHKDDQQMSMTNALISALPGVDPSLRDMLKGQGPSPETQRIRQQAQAIVEAYYREKQGGPAPAPGRSSDNDPFGIRKR